jgi:hypothetical protein
VEDWPISISEAARRLEIPFNTASVLVRAFDIPTVTMVNYQAKGIDRAGFGRLKEASVRFRRPSRPLASATH